MIQLDHNLITMDSKDITSPFIALTLCSPLTAPLASFQPTPYSSMTALKMMPHRQKHSLPNRHRHWGTNLARTLRFRLPPVTMPTQHQAMLRQVQSRLIAQMLPWHLQTNLESMRKAQSKQ